MCPLVCPGTSSTVAVAALPRRAEAQIYAWKDADGNQVFSDRVPTAEYRTVLAPTDFSAPSRAALQTCIGLLPQATVHVAHAFELPYEGLARYASVDPDTLVRYQREARARLHETLRNFADEVGVAPGRRVLHVAHGYAPKCIDQWIETTGADLVVIAAHGKSELEATFLGSVSLHTVMAAHCDVLLLRGGAARAS